jgi:PAS domain S-box-containing protein
MEPVAGAGFSATAQELADALPDGIVVVDSAGTIISVNAQLAEMTRYSRDDLLGRSVDSLVPAGRGVAHASHRAAFSEHPAARPMGADIDTVCQRSDGTLFPVDIALSPLCVAGETYVVATVHEATAGRAIVAAGQEAEERFRLLLESASGLAIFMLDAHGRVSTWNIGAQRIKGYQRDEIIGRPFSIFYTPEDQAAGRPERLLQEASATGRSEEFGWRVRKDGSRFQASVTITASLDRDGRVRGFTKIVRDNSTALRARDAVERMHLLEQREQLGRDLHDGVIQSVFAVGMTLEALLARVEDAAVAEGLQQSVGALDNTITELREFISGLATELPAARIRAEFERLATEVRARSGIEMSVVIDAAALAAVTGAGRDLLLVAREAISNVERHSGASTCLISLQRAPDDAVELVVQDNGAGFDASLPSLGLGLSNARARAEGMRAMYSVLTSPAGTRVILRLPTASFRR